LRHAELLGGLREAAPLDDGAEGGELARIDKESLSTRQRFLRFRARHDPGGRID
jgi:hypothetical protein